MERDLLIEEEKRKALKVITEYNIKYKTDEYKKLVITYEYLNKIYETETDNNNKKRLLEDITTIKPYL
jgi:hypothetical protein